MSINSVVNDTVTGESVVNALKPKPPTISGYAISGVDDTALDPAGGQTVQINGTGFLAGATITFDGSAVAVVTYVNPNRLTFTSPAKTAGTYTIYVVNSDGGTAIYIPGIIYSLLPTWTTSAGTLGSYYETQSIANTVVASGDAPVTYSLYSGSLPTGATLAANGVITGTAPVDSSSTTYSFTIQATDAQLQDSTRSFSLTINVDAVTWVSPANATTYTSTANSAIANVALSATDAAGYSVSYSANALPTGLSLTGSNIAGTPTVIADSSTLLTATAATTNRSATRTINWSITVANDPYFEYNTLLIPGASTTFVDDASTNNFAVTINGDTKPNNTNPYTPGYYSNYFDGTGDYLNTPATSILDVGNTSWTIECWIYLNNVSGQKFIVGYNNTSASDFWDLRTDTGVLTFRSRIGGTEVAVSGGTVLVNTWNHVALVRNGTAVTIYLNGSSVATNANVSMPTSMSNQVLGIGVNLYTGGVDYFNGFISNLRIVKGTAVYTTTFTPPTTPLTAIANTSLLTCQSNRFLDNSTNNFTITRNGDTKIQSFTPFTPNMSYSTYGSGYFDGSSSLSCNVSGISAGTSTFTFEAWVLVSSIASASTLFDTRSTNGASTTGMSVGIFATSGGIKFYDGGADNNLGGGITANVWTHIALVRNSSNVITAYVNGTATGTTVSSTRNFTDNYFWIASVPGPASPYLNGYMSNLRWVVGTAVYTANFTPPTTPLTAISGTSLLTLQNNQSVNNNVFLDNSTNNFLVTRNGNTTQGTFTPYGGNWSNYFDGAATSYIQTPAGSTTAILGTAGGGITPTATFTVECWIYQTQRHTSTTAPCLTGDVGVNGSLYWAFGPDYTGKLAFYHYTGAQVLATGNDTIPLNTWTHIAMSINSGAIKLFVNGNLQTITGATTTGTQNGTFGYLLTGGWYQFGTLAGYYGNLSNLRIVKSALYSTTFTPSTTPLTPITNTGLLMCQSSRFIDNSPNAFALTTGSTLSVQRFSPFNPSSLTPTSYSGYFDGSGDYLTVPFNSAFNLGSGNFTIEFWVNTKSTAAYATALRLGDTWTTGSWALYLNDAGGSGIPSWWSQTLGQTLSSSGATINDGAWHHIALVRNGATMTMYIDGTSRGTLAVSTSSVGDTSTSLWIARDASNVRELAGYLSNIRIVKGTALYTTTFTPSTTPLTTTSQGVTASTVSILTCQSPTFIDNSTNNFTITVFGNSQPTQQNPFGFTSATTNGYTASTIGGSGYFDGTGDYLSTPASVNLALGSSSFTIESWVYVTNPSISSYPTFIANWTGSWGSNAWSVHTGHSSYPNKALFYCYNYNAATPLLQGSTTLVANTWYHIAVVRNSNSFTLYLNGVSEATGTFSGAVDSGTSNTIYVVSPVGANSWAGYITDARIVKGTALYTSNFVPPSAPVVAVQNSSLLLNMTSAGVYDAAMMTNMETVGDAKLSTAVSKFGGSSMYFDGNDNLSIPLNTTLMNIRTGDFTIEGWVYHLDSNAYSGYYYGGTNGVVLRRTDANKLEISHDGVASIIVSTTSIPSNQWVHVAGTRSGSTVRIFINGTVAGTATYGTSIVGTSAGTVGSIVNIAGYYMNGYIDDFRITKGLARYTSNFTPPTEQFQAK